MSNQQVEGMTSQSSALTEVVLEDLLTLLDLCSRLANAPAASQDGATLDHSHRLFDPSFLFDQDAVIRPTMESVNLRLKLMRSRRAMRTRARSGIPGFMSP